MDSVFPMPSEELRKKLLKEEFKLRKKQPEHWAKTKYRKYAKPFKEAAPAEKIYAEEPHEMEKAEKAAKKVRPVKKKLARKPKKAAKPSRKKTRKKKP